MKSAIIVFPGSNCDRDARAALRHCAGKEPQMVWHKERALPPVDMILLPGGFSYGDYLRAGAIAAKSPIMEEVVRKAKDGVAVLGICNGFQILTETGLLPGALMRNDNLAFICRNVRLVVQSANPPFASSYQERETISMPIAHHGGNYQADRETIARLENEGQILFRYAKNDNPNGSVKNIAGILNEKGNVLGLMPHPERAYDEETGGAGGADGAKLFMSLARSL